MEQVLRKADKLPLPLSISPQRAQRAQRKEHYYLKETDNIRQRRGAHRGLRSEGEGKKIIFTFLES